MLTAKLCDCVPSEMALRRALSEMPYRFCSRAVAESDLCRSAFKFLSTTREIDLFHFHFTNGVLYVTADGYRFAKSHEWVNVTDTGSQEATVGISDFAQVRRMFSLKTCICEQSE